MKAEIYWIDCSLPGRLAVMPRPRGGDWLEEEIGSLRLSGVNVLVSLLTFEEMTELELVGEARCCAADGIRFVSFPIPDRSSPESAAAVADLVTNLGELLTGGKSVAIHCRQGIGRAGLIAACVLVSFGQTPAEVLQRISASRGRPVPETPEQRDWLMGFAENHPGRFGRQH